MDLVTVDDYNLYKRIKNPDNNELTISIIQSCIDIVRNYCGRNFTDYYNTTKTEYFDGNTEQVFLDEIPVVSVVDVKISTDGGVTQTELVQNVDYFVEEDSGTIVSSIGNFINSAIRHKSLQVRYRGGYADIPYDLKIAILDLVHYYKEGEYVPRKSMDTSFIQHISSEDYVQWPPHVRRIFDFYRLVKI